MSKGILRNRFVVKYSRLPVTGTLYNSNLDHTNSKKFSFPFRSFSI